MTWPLLARKVVSNDEMRDHQFSLPVARTFLRWRDRHVVQFNFGKHGPIEERLRLMHPPPFSAIMQEDAPR